MQSVGNGLCILTAFSNSLCERELGATLAFFPLTRVLVVGLFA